MTLQISGKQILCEGDIYKISSESKYIVTNFCRIMGFFSTLKLNNVLIDKISDYSYDDSNTQHFFRQINPLFFFQAICLLLSVANFGWFFSQIGKFERLNAFFFVIKLDILKPTAYFCQLTFHKELFSLWTSLPLKNSNSFLTFSENIVH